MVNNILYLIALPLKTNIFKIVQLIEESMSKIAKKTLFFLLFPILVINAQKTYDFLKLDTSPRAAALAGSFVSNIDDPNVIFYNPAGIYGTDNTPVSFSYVNHLMDISSASVSAVHQVEDIGYFSAGVRYMSYGSFVEADEFGARTGEFNASDIAFQVGYSNQLGENFNYGINAKYIYSSIAEYSSSAYAFDLGLMYSFPDDDFNIGFAALNLGSQMSSYINTKEELPLDVRFGISKGFRNLPFTFYLSFNKMSDKQDNFGDRFSQFTFGGEIKLSKALKLRLGYDNEKRKELKIGSTAGLAGFNFGVGITISKYSFDYAITSLGQIGTISRLGLSTAF